MGKTEGKGFREIAVCLAKYYDETNARILKTLCDRAAENGVRIVIYATCSDLKDMNTSDVGEEKVFDYLMTHRYDAIAVFPETFGKSEKYREIIEYADKAGIPVISVNRKIEGCYNIIYDYVNSFERVVRHVIKFHGARRVNFIAGMRDNAFSDERLACYKKVISEYGIEYDERRVGYGEFWDGPAARVTEQFMKDPGIVPDAIICANDTMAIACCDKLAEMGYRVPEDVIVTGFDGIFTSEMYSPRITTAKLNIDMIAEDILNIVCSLGDSQAPKEYLVKHDLCILQSCGCAGPFNAENFGRILFDMAQDRDRSLFICNESCKMLTRLNSPQKLQELLDEFARILDNGSIAYAAICTEDDMLSPYFNFAKCSLSDRVPEYMHVPFIREQRQTGSHTDIATGEIVPDHDEVMKRCGNLIILSMHAEELCCGYIACSFENDDFSAGQYQWVFIHFMHALNNYRRKQDIEDLFSRDYLTGLYSRRGFYANIEPIMNECREKKRPFTVISFDMDCLKKINDGYGHEAGDFALRSISEAMVSVLDDEKYAARTGGDEFLIAFAGMDGESESEAYGRAEELVSRIRRYLERASDSDGRDIRICISSGIAAMIPKMNTHIDAYLKTGDARMYSEKREHRKLVIAQDSNR